MNVAIVVATAVLLLQGTRIVIRPGAPAFVRAFGVLTLLLAGLSLVLFGILFWGEAVLSPEFDVVMARGHWRGLVILVMGFAVTAGLGLYVQRLKALLPGRLGRLLLLGLAVGAAAAMRIVSLNAQLSDQDTGQAFWVYSYDLWWPPLLIWVSACFLDGAITVLGVHNRRIRTGAFLIMLLVLSLRARVRGVFADPSSAMLWNLTAVAAALGGLLFILWLAWSARLRPEDARERLRVAAPGFGPALRRGWKRMVTDGWAGFWEQAWSWLRPKVGQLLAVLALATIAASLTDIFYIGWLPQAGALVVLATAWTCLAEVTAKGPLRAFVVDVVPEAYEKLAHQESWIRHVWLVLGERLAHPLTRIGVAMRRIVSLRPFPEAIVKISVLFVALVVAYEIPHAGKTLLQPFAAIAVNQKQGEVPTLSAQADIGRAVFDHLINTLGTLTLELQPDVILLLPPDAERGARFRTLAAGGAGTIDLFLTQDTTVEVGGGIKIPVGLVLRPVLQPIRWLLRVRVVDGSVFADQQGYTVLVRSGSGEVWRTRLDLPVGDDAATRSVADKAFSRLAVELAFRIMSTEPSLAKFGMTRSWDAFMHFKRGLESWQEFSLQRGQADPDGLSAAIRHFRIAVGVDPDFALAHYRLGMALHQDGQPLAAAEALRASLKANPGFVPAMVALASVLYGSEHDLGPQPIWLPMTPQRPSGTAKRDEARHLWQSVINVESGASSLDRAAAWAGLCRYALDQPEHMHDRTPARESQSYRIAYFYCQQSERLYAALFATPRQDLRVKTARAAELVSIGVLLERHGPKWKSRMSNDWQCSPAGIDGAPIAADSEHLHRSVPVGYYTRAALTYYRQALRLLPDDSVLQCHEASAAREPGLMQALRSGAASRWNLAEGYRSEARRHLKAALRADEAAPRTSDRQDPGRRSHGELAAAYFGLALAEYQATLDRDPTNFEALNRYANVFWDWRRGETSMSAFLEPGPGLEHGRRAEANARRAVAMVEGKQIRSAGPDTAQPSMPQVTSAASAPVSGKAAGAASDEPISRHLRTAAATARASLGAVLVAVGRPHEAIEELKYAQQYAPEHASFDYVRWLFAQAHLCAARREFQDISGPRTRDDPRLEPIAVHRVEAASSLDAIRAHERTRESRPIAGLADIGKADDICRRDRPWPATPKDQKWMYELGAREVADNYRGLCLWLGVTVELPEGWAEERDKALSLHVWGGGVDARIPVERRERRIDRPDRSDRLERLDPISLMPPPLRRFYFMAQLEDAQQQPVSPALFLKPPSEEPPVQPSPPRCPDAKNLILLSFDRAGAALARAAAGE
jgi:tetratricopeptide (TPR) repeat protein